MDFRIHHVGLPLQDPENTLKKQREQFGLQHVCTFVIPDKLVNYFSGNGCDVSLHLMGDPLYPYQVHYVEKHGRTWEHINFLVEDTEAAFETLVSKGAVPRCKPCRMAHVNYSSVGDPEYDVIYEFMKFRDDDDLALGEVVVEETYQPDDLRLGQISLVVPDLCVAEARFTEFFNLQTVYAHTRDGSGFILMTDHHWDATKHNFALKVWGGPNAGAREQAILREKGALFDCIAFYAEDVEAAYAKAVSNGARGVVAPRFNEAYGGYVAWTTDAEGNDISIVEAPPAVAISAALETHEVASSWE